MVVCTLYLLDLFNKLVLQYVLECIRHQTSSNVKSHLLVSEIKPSNRTSNIALSFPQKMSVYTEGTESFFF